MSGKMNVLLIGGGGREHALAQKLVQSRRLGDLWITNPENAGLAALGKAVDVPVGIREIYRLEQFCDKHKIGMVVIGPEEPLCEGMAAGFLPAQERLRHGQRRPPSLSRLGRREPRDSHPDPRTRRQPASSSTTSRLRSPTVSASSPMPAGDTASLRPEDPTTAPPSPTTSAA